MGIIKLTTLECDHPHCRERFVGNSDSQPCERAYSIGWRTLRGEGDKADKVFCPRHGGIGTVDNRAMG